MEDEIGIENVVIHPDLYERERVVVKRGKFLCVEGKLQNQDGVIRVKAERVELLGMKREDALEVKSHDFH